MKTFQFFEEGGIKDIHLHEQHIKAWDGINEFQENYQRYSYDMFIPIKKAACVNEPTQKFFGDVVNILLGMVENESEKRKKASTHIT